MHCQFGFFAAGAQREPTATPEKAAAAGNVFMFSLKGIPAAVDAEMEARLEAAARKRKRPALSGDD